MKKPNVESLEKKLEDKARRRALKKKAKMKVDGAGVKKLLRVIKEKSL